MQLLIDGHGVVRCLYTEAVDLSALGALKISRASHVEPDPAGRWWADLAPVLGPRLGPFAMRSMALAAEIAWIETNCLCSSMRRGPGAQNHNALIVSAFVPRSPHFSFTGNS